MRIDKKETYTLISSKSSSFANFLLNFEKEHPKLEKEHLIIQFSEELNIVDKDIFVFLAYAELHQQNGTTFVVIFKNVDLDMFPETFNIVPTLQEAEDVLEMENIQRDLGF